MVATQGYEGPYNARWAVQGLGKKKIATIYINNDWGVDANKYFTQEAKKLGAEIVADEAFTPGEKDFTAILSKLKLSEVDTFYGPIQALRNVSLRVEDGEIVSLLGGNACGKSTTMKTILGLVK